MNWSGSQKIKQNKEDHTDGDFFQVPKIETVNREEKERPIITGTSQKLQLERKSSTNVSWTTYDRCHDLEPLDPDHWYQTPVSLTVRPPPPSGVLSSRIIPYYPSVFLSPRNLRLSSPKRNPTKGTGRLEGIESLGESLPSREYFDGIYGRGSSTTIGRPLNPS